MSERERETDRQTDRQRVEYITVMAIKAGAKQHCFISVIFAAVHGACATRTR